jgi:curli biogenesis system outer membrane secretion channel CsgG
MVLKRIATVSTLTCLLALAQDKPAPAPVVKKPAAAVASPVDKVIQLVKGGMSESMIVKTLQRENKPITLSTDDMLKLQKAGVSENIMSVMMDPSSAPGGAAPSAAPATPHAAPATAVAAAPAAAGTVAPAANAAPGPACTPPAAVTAVAGSQKRRLAVQAFDYSAVHTQVTAMFGNDVNIGQGIRAILTSKMAQSKSVVLVEREKLKSVMAEQDFGATNRVKQGTKAKIGGITGADAILMGDIVIFGRDDTGKKTSAGGVGRALPGYFGTIGGAVGSAKKTDKAVVAINLRLVDAETGEIIEGAESRGESTRTSTDWGAVAGSWRGAAAASSGMTSSNFQETIIGEATMDAVTKIAAYLEVKIPSIAAKSRTIEGRVANFNGCTLYISVGGNDGVQVGDHFEIHQILSEVLDPDTKEVLDKQTVKVGEFVVATVRDKVSIGQYGGDPLQPTYAKGYAARLVAK